MKKIRNILGIIIAVGAVIGILFSLDAYVAKAKDVQQLEIRLDQKILQDRSDFLQEQIWKFEDRYGYNLGEMKEDMRDRYRRLKKSLEDAKNKLRILTKEND